MLIQYFAYALAILLAMIVFRLISAGIDNAVPWLRKRRVPEPILDGLAALSEITKHAVRDAEQRIVSDIKSPLTPSVWSPSAGESVKRGVLTAVHTVGQSVETRLRNAGMDQTEINRYIDMALEGNVAMLRSPTRTSAPPPAPTAPAEAAAPAAGTNPLPTPATTAAAP